MERAVQGGGRVAVPGDWTWHLVPWSDWCLGWCWATARTRYSQKFFFQPNWFRDSVNTGGSVSQHSGVGLELSVPDPHSWRCLWSGSPRHSPQCAGRDILALVKLESGPFPREKDTTQLLPRTWHQAWLPCSPELTLDAKKTLHSGGSSS